MITFLFLSSSCKKCANLDWVIEKKLLEHVVHLRCTPLWGLKEEEFKKKALIADSIIKFEWEICKLPYGRHRALKNERSVNKKNFFWNRFGLQLHTDPNHINIFFNNLVFFFANI